MILLDLEEMGVRTACRPITNSIHFLIIPLLLLCLEYLDLERSARGLRSTSWAAHSYPRTSLYIHSSPRYPPLIASAHSYSAPLTYIEKISRSMATITSGSIGTYYFDIGPVGEHTEKKTSDITGFHILLWCKFQLFL